MTLSDFVDSRNGKYVDVDSEYGAQCWDLVEDYAENVLEVPKNPWAITLNPDKTAKSAWLAYDQNPQLIQYFDKVDAGQEQTGDILVYNGHGDFTEGHIAVCLGGGLVFEQNADPDDSPCHTYRRATTYLLGALRFKGDENMQQDISDLFTALDKTNKNVDALFTTVDAINQRLDKIVNAGGVDDQAFAAIDAINKRMDKLEGKS